LKGTLWLELCKGRQVGAQSVATWSPSSARCRRPSVSSFHRVGRDGGSPRWHRCRAALGAGL